MNAMAQMSAVFQDDIPNFVPDKAVISSLEPLQAHIYDAQHIPQWVIDLTDRFVEITSLPIGWDGYAGLPVSFSSAHFAANLIGQLCVSDIPAPHLVPVADGTLQLEWHMNQYDLEIDVLAPYNVVATRYDLVSRKEERIELQGDFSELAEWITELGNERTSFLLAGD